MRLKLSKKSLQRESASCLGGRGMNVRRANKSLKISGRQYTHFVSSAAAVKIISWKELSPVFSLIHCMPFGEKMENPDDEPRAISSGLGSGSRGMPLTDVSSFSIVIGHERAHHI